MRFLEWLLYGKLVERPGYMDALMDIEKLHHADALDVSYKTGPWGRRHIDSNHVQGRGNYLAEELYRRIAHESNIRNVAVEARKRRAGIIIELSDDSYHRKFTVSLHNQIS